MASSRILMPWPLHNDATRCAYKCYQWDQLFVHHTWSIYISQNFRPPANFLQSDPSQTTKILCVVITVIIKTTILSLLYHELSELTIRTNTAAVRSAGWNTVLDAVSGTYQRTITKTTLRRIIAQITSQHTILQPGFVRTIQHCSLGQL